MACALGRSGLREHKWEGDGGTPVGTYPLRRLLYRPDRLGVPVTGLPVFPLDPADGWCDDPGDPNYNRPIRVPNPARHEVLWRSDHLYDLVVVIGHNDQPAVPNRGSAIFLHVAEPGLAPTEGCVAVALEDMLTLIADCGPDDRLTIRFA